MSAASPTRPGPDFKLGADEQVRHLAELGDAVPKRHRVRSGSV